VTPWTAAAAAAVVSLVLAVPSAAMPNDSTESRDASSSPSVTAPLRADDVVPPAPPALDRQALLAFRHAARKPAASPPVGRLPRVLLGAIHAGDIPPAAYAAYKSAASRLRHVQPSCALPWWLLAGIGFVESHHAAGGGSLTRGWNGIARPHILGPLLDGSHGFAAIRDSDHGRFDGNAHWDRAVGPMQFLPSTWLMWGARPSGTLGNPEDIRDAARAAGGYLCAGNARLSNTNQLALAVYRYNHSFDYVRLVLSVAARYAQMSPAALGIDRLPKDRPAARRHHHHRRHRPARPAHTAKPASSPTVAAPKAPSPSASATTGESSAPIPASPSDTPSASPTQTPTATDSPTPTGSP